MEQHIIYQKGYRLPCFGLRTDVIPEFPDKLVSVIELLKSSGLNPNPSCFFRSKQWEKVKGRSGLSQHTLGRAVDLSMSASEKAKALDILKDWEGGLGTYPWGLHVDIAKKRRWNG